PHPPIQKPLGHRGSTGAGRRPRSCSIVPRTVVLGGAPRGVPRRRGSGTARCPESGGTGARKRRPAAAAAAERPRCCCGVSAAAGPGSRPSGSRRALERALVMLLVPNRRWAVARSNTRRRGGLLLLLLLLVRLQRRGRRRRRAGKGTRRAPRRAGKRRGRDPAPPWYRQRRLRQRWRRPPLVLCRHGRELLQLLQLLLLLLLLLLVLEWRSRHRTLPPRSWGPRKRRAAGVPATGAAGRDRRGPLQRRGVVRTRVHRCRPRRLL
ncbi:unnamed protein product, partial [Ectocarpus fasciculatus]